MTDSIRKASDVLLDLESKVNILLNIVKSQELNIKILSNKLSLMIDNQSKGNVNQPQRDVNFIPPSMFDSKNPIEPSFDQISEEKFEIDKSPIGFRRTSRPESFVTTPVQKTTPIPPSKGPMSAKDAEVVVPNIQQNKKAPIIPVDNTFVDVIPVIQRVVDSNGKAIFLANVEILDLSNGNTFAKIKTNAIGKWMSSMPVGNYKVFIKRKLANSQEILEKTQVIKIDGSKANIELETIVLR